jgi:hypothetical protein
MRDFGARDVVEQEAFLTHNCFEQCQQANLGLHTVFEYELNGVQFIEGKCAGCGEPVLTELTDDDF